MKMKKLFGLLSIIACLSFFTSCETDQLEELLNNGPEITFKAKEGYTVDDVTVETGQEIKFSWEVVATVEKLASFTIRENNQDLEGFPKDKIDRNEYQDEYITAFAEAGTYTLAFIATDKAGKANTEQITITVEEPVAPTTPLADANAFEWVREGSNEGTGLDQFGLAWTSNTSTHAVIKKGADKFVELTKEDWTKITTKEALKEAVDKATSLDKIEKVSVEKNEDYDIVLATQKGDDYFLIHVIKGTVTSGNNGSTKIIITGESKK